MKGKKLQKGEVGSGIAFTETRSKLSSLQPPAVFSATPSTGACPRTPRLFLITGGCKNGKSSFAQELASELSGEETPVYFATMISHDEEDDERIKNHREDRKNLGFETIECGKNIPDVTKKIEGRVVLFDSLTALVQNEMFDSDFTAEVLSFDKGCAKNLSSIEEKITRKIRSDLEIFIKRAKAVVFVSDFIFSDGKIYDEITELYRIILAKTENFLAEKCEVIEMQTGKKSVISNEQLEVRDIGEESENSQFSILNSHLIIGGAYQGKTDFAKKAFCLSDSDICLCSANSTPDFTKKCLSHYENYVAYCLKNNLSPKTDFDSSKGDHTKIIICDDIFCGVVPIDSFQRRLREQTGLALQKIAEKSEVYRVFCGIAQKIKL